MNGTRLRKRRMSSPIIPNAWAMKPNTNSTALTSTLSTMARTSSIASINFLAAERGQRSHHPCYAGHVDSASPSANATASFRQESTPYVMSLAPPDVGLDDPRLGGASCARTKATTRGPRGGNGVALLTHALSFGKKFALGGDPWVCGDRGGDAVQIMTRGQERIGQAAHDRHFTHIFAPNSAGDVSHSSSCLISRFSARSLRWWFLRDCASSPSQSGMAWLVTSHCPPPLCSRAWSRSTVRSPPGVEIQNLQFQVRDTTTEEVRAFYLQQLPLKGWTCAKVENAHIITSRQGNRDLSVVLMTPAETGGRVVMVPYPSIIH